MAGNDQAAMIEGDIVMEEEPYQVITTNSDAVAIQAINVTTNTPTKPKAISFHDKLLNGDNPADNQDDDNDITLEKDVKISKGGFFSYLSLPLCGFTKSYETTRTMLLS